MNKKKVRNLIIVATLSAVTAILAFKRTKNKNYLKLRNLINKDTKILDVYTCDYIIQNLLILKDFSSLIDKKEDVKSSVYTFRAKEIVLDVCDENIESKNTFEEEYKQIVRFATELNEVAPDAKMVIHVASNIESDKFEKIKYESIIKKMSIAIEISTELTEDIFEEE